MFLERLLLWGSWGLLWMRKHPFRIVLLIILGLFLLQPVPWGVTHFLPQICGHSTNVVLGDGPQTQPTPELAAQCFLLAHQHCQAADLLTVGYGVDTSGESTYSTTNSLGNCVITVVIKSNTPPMGCHGGIGCLLHAIAQPWLPNTTCQSVRSVQKGVVFTECSDGREYSWP